MPRRLWSGTEVWSEFGLDPGANDWIARAFGSAHGTAMDAPGAFSGCETRALGWIGERCVSANPQVTDSGQDPDVGGEKRAATEVNIHAPIRQFQPYAPLRYTAAISGLTTR